MAEFGAHLVAPVLGSPSIFEVLAQESLHQSLRPAVEHLLKILVDKLPEYSNLVKYYHELYTALDFLIQHHFLKHYGSSFSENFYGLKRISLDTVPPSAGYKLSTRVHVRSLLCLVLIPYIKLRLNNTFEKERELEADGIRHKNKWLQKFRQIFLFVYPWIYSFWQSALFIYQLAFTFGKVRVHSPLMYLSGARLTTLTNEDVAISNENFKFPPIWSLGFSAMISALLKIAMHNFAVGLTRSLSVGAFFIQFLEWWQASNSHSILNASTFVPPPPPKLTQNALKLDPQLCPLCLNKRTNDTALSTSGYVFCYRCIHQYLQQHSACPITKYVSSSEHLVRLYPPDS